MYCEDYPIRADWSGSAETLLPRLEFSTDTLQPLQELLAHGSGPEQQRLVAELDHRFVGHPDAAHLRVQQQSAGGTIEPPVLLKAIADDPDDWPLYEQLAGYYVDHGQYHAASELVQSFPPFKNGRMSTVMLSNHAYDIGKRLYYLGAADDAKPLLQLAASFDNGSAASVVGAAKVALIDADYGSAASAYLAAARHYSSDDYYRDFLNLLFAGGESQSAWSGFEQVVQHFHTPPPWLAAMTGHRRDNIDETALRAWITTHANAAPGDQTPAMYALQEYMTDRAAPSADLVAFITTIAGPSAVHAQSGGHHYIGKLLDSDKVERRVGPSAYWLQRHPQAAPEATVPNRFVLLADAYAKLRAKDFVAAARAFDRLASFYDIESGEGWHFALPYFAFAAAQSGDEFELKLRLGALTDPKLPWTVRAAQAVFAAAEGDAKRADALMQKALPSHTRDYSRWPQTEESEYADICAMLADQTRDAQLRARALAWGRGMARVFPFYAWPHALTARYSSDHAEQVRELGIALYLDARSAWAAEQPQALRDEALRWVKANPPFQLKPAGNST